MREWKKVFHANGNEKKARVSIIISEYIDCEIKIVRRDKEEYNIMIK